MVGQADGPAKNVVSANPLGSLAIRSHPARNAFVLGLWSFESAIADCLSNHPPAVVITVTGIDTVGLPRRIGLGRFYSPVPDLYRQMQVPV